MPMIYDPDPGVSIPNLGFCPPQATPNVTCDDNSRNVDNLVDNYLKRSNSSVSRYIFDPGVTVLPEGTASEAMLQPGDLIYQRSNTRPVQEGVFAQEVGHIVFFLGWAPAMSPAPGTPLTFSNTPSSGDVKWVIDDRTDFPIEPRPFDERYSEIIQIPTTFTVDLEYLKATQP